MTYKTLHTVYMLFGNSKFRDTKAELERLLNKTFLRTTKYKQSVMAAGKQTRNTLRNTGKLE